MLRGAVCLLGLAAACRSAPPPPPEETKPPAPVPVVGLQELRERLAEVSDRAARLKQEAHDALDEGRYEDAADLHRRSREAERQADEAMRAEDAMMRDAVRRLLKELDDDELAVREAATLGLLELGVEPGLLREMAAPLAGEAARRVEQVLTRIDKRFNGRQWATYATASTEYSAPNWAAAQVTGEPNTNSAGDHTTAWAPREQDADAEWLLVSFEIPVRPSQIRIHETYNPGAITKVEAKDGSGAWRTLYEGAAAAVPDKRWFEVSVPGAAWTTREIRITLDSDAVPGWNEIDAVELIGTDPLRGGRR